MRSKRSRMSSGGGERVLAGRNGGGVARWVWWGVFGCGAGGSLPVADERAAYVDALAKATTDPQGALRDCERVKDPDLRGDCQTQAVVRGRVEGGCTRVEDTMWQEECAFQVADDARTRGLFDAALRSCEASGRFHDNCVYHVWQQDILRLAQGIDWKEARSRPPRDGPPTPPKFGPGDLVGATAAAEPLFADWQARLGPEWRSDGMLQHALPSPAGAPFAEVFWGRFYVELLERAPVIDVGGCDALGAHATACRAAAENVATRRVREQWRCGPFDGPGWMRAVPLAQVPDPALIEKLNRACQPF